MCTIPLPSGKMPSPPQFRGQGYLEEVEAVGPRVALAITSSKEPTKESDSSRAVEMNESQNLDAP